jgi:Na+/H+ antiporter NhaD/arsenite permease-like protein
MILFSATTRAISEGSAIVGIVIFVVSYFVFAVGKLPGTKIDRPEIAVIGATLMCLVGVLSPGAALRAIDFNTLLLLFAMMVIVASLRDAGFFDWITSAVIEHIPAEHLLPGVIFTAGLLSMFLVNDVVCVVMTPLLLDLMRRMQRPPLPYLLALATASNIGSTATITGNPQNMLIGSVSNIGYQDFLVHLGPVAVVGLFIDWAVLRWLCARDLAFRTDQLKAKDPAPQPVGADVARPAKTDRARLHGPVWKPVMVLLLVLIGFLLGWPPAMVAMTGAIGLLASWRINPKMLYEEVDWPLLLFFAGLFVILGGAEATGLMRQLFAVANHLNLQNVWSFSALAAILSNLVSNVPAVMLLDPLISHFRDQHAGWLVLAMASTLAGNLTITGSVANMIVVEKSRGEVEISFRQYLRVGGVITLLTLLAGVLWLGFVPS